MINRQAVAVGGVSFGPLAVVVDGIIISQSKKKKIPVQVPFQDVAGQVGGYPSGGTGSSSYGILRFGLTKDRPKSKECLDWAKCISDEIQERIYREKFIGRISGADTIEKISNSWICPDESLLIAAQASITGRLEPAVRMWAVTQLIEAGAPDGDHEKLVTLFESVRQSMYFVANPVGAQWISGADITTDEKMAAGSCIDYSIKLASSLLSVGIRAALVGQSSRRDGQLDHVAVAAWNGSTWVRLDPSEKNFRVGESRPSTREVWVHLPEMEIVHDGPSPSQIRTPELRHDDKFQVAGLGRLGWNPSVPIGYKAESRRMFTRQITSKRISGTALGQTVPSSILPLLATLVTVSLVGMVLFAIIGSKKK